VQYKNFFVFLKEIKFWTEIKMLSSIVDLDAEMFDEMT